MDTYTLYTVSNLKTSLKWEGLFITVFLTTAIIGFCANAYMGPDNGPSLQFIEVPFSGS